MKELLRLLLLCALVATLVVLTAAPAVGGSSSVGRVTSVALATGTQNEDDDDEGGGGGDAVFGGGNYVEAPGFSFAVDVTSGPLGETPSGTFRQDFAGGFVVAEATCLVVTGNTATIGGRITASSGLDPVFFAVGRGVVFTTQDNSPATPAPDRVSAFQSLPAPPTTQAGCVFQGTFFTVDGDVTVQDNTAVGQGDDGDDGDGDDGDGDDDDGDDDDGDDDD